MYVFLEYDTFDMVVNEVTSGIVAVYITMHSLMPRRSACQCCLYNVASTATYFMHDSLSFILPMFCKIKINQTSSRLSSDTKFRINALHTV